MKVLLKVSKLVPKLGTENEFEKMTTLLMIEKLLKNDGISWTDVGQGLSEFVTNVLKFEEEKALEGPTTNGAAGGAAGGGGWSSVRRNQPPPAHPQQPGPGPFAQPTQPPPRPPKRVDPRTLPGASAAQRTACIEELIQKKLWKDMREQNIFNSILMSVQVGLPLSPKYQKVFEEASKKL